MHLIDVPNGRINQMKPGHLIDAPNGCIDQMTPGHLIDAPNGRIDYLKTGKISLRPTARAANRPSGRHKKNRGPSARNFFCGVLFFFAQPTHPRGRPPAADGLEVGKC